MEYLHSSLLFLKTWAATVLIWGTMIGTLLVLWASNFLGLPGNWCIVLVALLFDWFMEDGSRGEVGWTLIIVLGLLAALGELIEFVAGAVGVRRKGGSRLSALLSLIGSFVGAIAGGLVALPIPVLGPVIGVLLGSSVGAMLGAILGEDIQGREPSQSIGVGWAAFWGRLFGTLGKSMIGGVMVAVTLAGMMF